MIIQDIMMIILKRNYYYRNAMIVKGTMTIKSKRNDYWSRNDA